MCHNNFVDLFRIALNRKILFARIFAIVQNVLEIAKTAEARLGQYGHPLCLRDNSDAPIVSGYPITTTAAELLSMIDVIKLLIGVPYIPQEVL